MPDKQYLLGKRFGKLQILEHLPSYKSLCLCDCGRTKAIQTRSVLSGHTTSCGCRHRELVTTHGHCVNGQSSPTYRSYYAMIQRCTNPKTIAWKDYGGRGITVCKRWVKSFECFLADMGEKPPGTTIERLDNNKSYEPGNCTWDTRLKQMHNTRKTRRFTVNGISGCISELSRYFGINIQTATARLRLGWTPEQAFNKQKRPYSRSDRKLL